MWSLERMQSDTDGECPQGLAWYACQNNGFRGCCTFDPCDVLELVCPHETPNKTAGTTSSAPSTMPVETTAKSVVTVTVSITPDLAPQPTGTFAPDQADQGSSEAPSSAAKGAPVAELGRDAALPPGAVAGILIGSVLAAVAILCLSWWFLCRRHRQRQRRARDPWLSDDSGAEMPMPVSLEKRPAYHGPRPPMQPPFGYSAAVQAAGQAGPRIAAAALKRAHARWERPEDVDTIQSPLTPAPPPRRSNDTDLVSPVSPQSTRLAAAGVAGGGGGGGVGWTAKALSGRERSSSARRSTGAHRGESLGHQATLRATPREIADGVDAGSWSVLNPPK